MAELRPPSAHLAQNWYVTKPVASGRSGVVVAQARAAAEAGIAALEAGGNAVDAAVATSFALFAEEPWNAGLGGVGFALVQAAGEPRASIVDFGPVAPLRLDPESYKLTGRASTEMFGWPEVERDANVHGPLSFCVPSAVAGLHAMHARWGRLPLNDLLAPAIELAKRGLPYDWFAALRVTQSAATLKLYPETARIYAPGGLPRPNTHPMTYVPLGNLAATLERLRSAGLHDMYGGDVGSSIATDCASRGGVLGRDDLAAYRVGIGPAGEVAWRGQTVQLATLQTAAPAMFGVLDRLAAEPGGPTPTTGPSPGWYVKLARTLAIQQSTRLGGDGSTSHLSVVDAAGGVVSLTTTLLSPFGSRVVLPQTGVLMNNGVMWFDPMRGRANSIRAGGRPLTNMCPVIVRAGGTGGGAPTLLAGASGGRKILSAVAQVVAYATEFGMDPATAMTTPRIDVSNPQRVTADHRLPPDVLDALRADGPIDVVEPALSPALFGSANLLAMDGHGVWSGASDPTPWSAALAVDR